VLPTSTIAMVNNVVMTGRSMQRVGKRHARSPLEPTAPQALGFGPLHIDAHSVAERSCPSTTMRSPAATLLQ
jgi:hypothetical protein